MKIQDSDIRNFIKTTVETSYVPTIILNDKHIDLLSKYNGNENELIKDKDFLSQSIQVQNWILTSIATRLYANVLPMHNPILDVVWNVISDIIFPGKKIRETRKNIQKYIDTAQKEYTDYVENHEVFIKEVQAQIDIINKCKPIMKGYILQKVVAKLQELGIDSQLSDYPMEFIDYRVFKLNQEFNYINEQFKKLNEDQYAKILENFPMIPVFPIILILLVLIRKKIKEIEKKFSLMQEQTKCVFEKMRSDNKKITDLSLSLGNIAKIYTEINSKFIPAIEGILDLIVQKYQNDIAKIPVEVLYLLRIVTKILKELAERRIIPQGNSDTIIDSVIEASNDISVTYENLRSEFSKAV